MAFQLENTRPTWLDVREAGASPKYWLPQNHKAETAWTASTQQIKSIQVLYLFMWGFFFHLFLISCYLCCYHHLFFNFDGILVLRLSRPKSVFFHSYISSVLRVPLCPALF